MTATTYAVLIAIVLCGRWLFVQNQAKLTPHRPTPPVDPPFGRTPTPPLYPPVVHASGVRPAFLLADPRLRPRMVIDNESGGGVVKRVRATVEQAVILHCGALKDNERETTISAMSDMILNTLGLSSKI